MSEQATLDEVFGYSAGPAFQLRDYQVDAVARCKQSLLRHRSVLLESPTGSGKTAISCSLLKDHLADHGGAAWFLAPRRELVFQTRGKLAQLGVDTGTLMAGERMSLDSPAQVASIPTIARRLKTGLPVEAPSLIVVDEAHAAFGAQTRGVLDAFPEARVLGVTATPARADGRGLGELYQAIVLGPSVRELTERGYLVPVRYFAPSKADLDGVRITAGDYNEKDLASRVNTPKLVGDVVANWQRIAGDRQTVVFAVDRAHALALHEEFAAAGVRSEYIDATTEHGERAAILHRIRTGQSQVICSVDVLSYGWDEPSISCGILARPTKSIARYLQSAGRILRPAPGKADSILIDHGGAVEEFGFLDEPRGWSLDSRSRVQERIEKARKEKPAADQVTSLVCSECKAEISPQPKCPECGAELRKQWARKVSAIEAELQEIRDRETKQQKAESRKRREEERDRLMGPNATPASKDWLFAQLLGWAQEKGWKRGWAFHKYREIHGEDPAKPWPEPCKPGPAVVGWCKAQQVRYARRRAA